MDPDPNLTGCWPGFGALDDVEYLGRSIPIEDDLAHRDLLDDTHI
jgi:hypothetical protein